MTLRETIKKHKIITALIVIVLVIVIAFFGFKLYLYISYLVGNDLVILLDSNNKDMQLAYGQNGSAEMSMSTVTSPLCTTKCEFTFIDISKNKTLDRNSFSLTQITQKKIETINIDKEGSGQELFRYTLTCRNTKTIICHTSGTPVSREVLLSVEYMPNEEQKNYLKMLSQNIYETYNKSENLRLMINNGQAKLAEISNTMLIENDFYDQKKRSYAIHQNFIEIENLWKIGKYSQINDIFTKIKIDNIRLENDFNLTNETINSNIEKYNGLVDSLYNFSENLKELSQKMMNNNDSMYLDGIITEFNNKIESFTNTQILDDKTNIVNSIIENRPAISDCNTNIDLNDTISNCTYKANVGIKFNLTHINIDLTNFTDKNININNLSLSDPLPVCCVYNKCKPCGIVEGEYPVIFVHGHDFNKDISAEYSIDAFQDIQNKLDDSGYIDAGKLTLYDGETNYSGRLGYAGVPMTVRTTYYFDVLKETNSLYLPVQVKSENIDSYSIRLRTLIDKLKYETGQPKVIIITHSMGGLVARRYIQLFGNGSVDKLIMIASPNNGIEGEVARVCSLFGAQAECTDLTSGSLLLNKLNNDPMPKVKTYNFIGTGCIMNGEEGDGIVLNRNAFLVGSIQYYINGSCSGINFLHNEILNSDKYPELYSRIIKILETG